MPTILEEAIEAMETINCEVFEQNEKNPIIEDYFNLLTLSSNGDCHIIMISDFPLWNSEDDSDRYSNSGDTEEPIESYVRRKLAKFIADLDSLKFIGKEAG